MDSDRNVWIKSYLCAHTSVLLLEKLCLCLQYVYVQYTHDDDEDEGRNSEI
jgi:hypothetical protein